MKLLYPALLLLVALTSTFSVQGAEAWGFGGGSDPGKVLMKDVTVLTLYEGQMTSGRRSSPVPQLNCVGGSAKHADFKPAVVQCYNRGFDGRDVQVSNPNYK